MTLAPGTKLGPYEIVSSIGAGGMGEVYKARDTRLDRLVAVKVISEKMAGDPSALARFEREAKAVAALSHPNILAIFDFGSEGGVTYAVMELLEGETLRERLARGPLPPSKAQDMALQIASGLAAAHEKGIVHRDLKPGNVFVTKAGHAKILDFGLAKLMPREEPAPESLSQEPTAEAPTFAGAVLGTVGYMAPEQARGLPADARSDVFAFGVVLYEMLSGRRPFERGSALDTLAAILKEEPAPIQGLPAGLSRLLDLCLRKEASERYPSASQLEAAVASCGAGTGAAAPERERPSVAVFPFANVTGAKEDDYLCEGLAEEIINDLTRIPGLRVIARTSSFAVARMGLDVREAGARLEVGSILEGSVRRSGGRVRVTAQLIDTAEGSHILSERYDRELTDVLALEEEIASAIASRLRGALGRRESSGGRPAANPEAHAAYLEGRYHFARQTPASLAQAKACYELAIARDPGFALAYDSLAELYWFLGLFGGALPKEAYSQSTWLALRALELDDTLAQTHALLAMLRKELDYNWPEVERENRRAFELCPDSPLVRLRYVISSCVPHGRLGEGTEVVESLLRDDPLSVVLHWWLAVFFYLGRKPDGMIGEGRRMIALDPAHFMGHWSLGVGLGQSGAALEAVPHLERANQLSGGMPFTLGFLAYFSGRAGLREQALQLLRQAESAAGLRYVPPTALALCHLGLGNTDDALEWFDRAIEARDPIIMPIKTFDFLDPLRKDPRFSTLLHKMRLS